ncbi:cupin domain-containing protein [Curtobacterium sp. ME-Dv--P-122a]|uniref:cupin domain-containing protein n=1 Tax=Curtobacterium sp. ME-Dv--P-122a TaxID=3040286 RepID=UPI0025518741|nr:cupin domain-containing protein [Curtobacterium sp. ME-Dv--P-122a]
MPHPEPTTTLIATVDGPDGGTYEVRRLTLPTGASTGWHQHDARQTGLVVRGALTHVTEEATRVVGPGQALVEEPRIVHDGRSTGTEDAELLYVAHLPAGAAASTPGEAPPSEGPVRSAFVTVPLGRPQFVHALRYTAMYAPKPFAEALLVYRDNGTYTILSPGEDHHGCYVSATDPAEGMRHVAFMSWPSADWGRNIASHTLTFEAASGAFTQELRLPGDPVPRAQYGYAVPVEDPESIDTGAGWATLRQQYAGVFTTLERLAGGGSTAA